MEFRVKILISEVSQPQDVGNEMKTKIIVLLLVLGAVLFSGCAGNEQPPSPEENATPGETTTQGENITPVQPETPGENVTVTETETPEENVISEENATSGALEVLTPDIKEAAYHVRLKDYRASASSLEIKEGEKVAWINMQENPKRPLTLVSEQDLFENTNLVYKHPFTYTFNETGEYNFSVVGQPRMNVSVSVIES
jgi:plastocyanin